VSEESQSYKILIVDDDPKILRVLGKILESRDYNVITTDKTDLALKELEQSEVAVIVSDLEMPEMSGIKLLEQAKEISPKTIRIMLTGHPHTVSKDDASEVLAVHRFLLKPVSVEDFLDVIEANTQLYLMG
jgi:response regulator RpfG family c-di-GMP phosphodiesterase